MADHGISGNVERITLKLGQGCIVLACGIDRMAEEEGIKWEPTKVDPLGSHTEIQHTPQRIGPSC